MPHTPSKAAEAAFDDSFSLTRGIMVRAWARWCIYAGTQRVRKRKEF